MEKIVIVSSKIILIIALLNIFAWSVYHVNDGGKKLGFLTQPIQAFSTFPQTVVNVFRSLDSLPPYQVRVDDDFEEINRLDHDLFSLNAHFESNKYVYELSNLKTDSILNSWSFTKEQYYGPSEWFPIAYPQNPILLKDMSMIGMLYGTKNLFRLDKSSNIIWQDTSRYYHHSLNMSHDNYIWASTYVNIITTRSPPKKPIYFRDDVLTKIDPQTGKIVFEKPLSELLISNGYINLVHGYANQEESDGVDLFHLNDIEPILSNGKFWMQGDLLLSLRNRSMIIHYRPETDKILRIISGPFLAQHDVDVVSDGKISIFNNNRVATNALASQNDIENAKKTNLTLNISNIVVYDFLDSTFSTPFLDLFETENVYTPRQGVHTFLKNGSLFVESTETGKIYIFDDNKVIFKKYANKPSGGTTEHPHWMTIHEHLNFLNQ